MTPPHSTDHTPGLMIGCDTGGTFTDFVMFDPSRPEDGIVTAKVSSTPDDPSRAILEGLRLLTQGRPLAELCHATTVATNTLLEGTGGRVGFLITRGFGDSLWLGRGERSDLYSLRPSRKQPPLSREDVWEVEERSSAQGEVLLPLEEAELARLAGEISRREGLQALAVCLFHSTVSPAHEQALGKRLRGLPVFLSHQVAPSPGEYERGMTTLLAATLAPKIEEYLERLQQATNGTKLWIVHSAGGLLQPEEARRNPHRLALSGPAAGLRGALSLSRAYDINSIITLDMGGTSSDVALCHDGHLPYVWETEIEGYPLRAPSLEIHTIGAGGGSIAYRDAGALLRVGPRSAGAQPGPACYGRGGVEPTVTDALCWAGYLPEKLGELPLDREASEQALGRLARSIELSIDQTALGILSIAVGHLGLAVRKVSTGRGHDPQQFTMLPFGGAGPMLCCQVAETLDMRSIMVPASAGVLSAWGALTAPWEREWSAPLAVSARTDPAEVQRALSQLEAHAEAPFDDVSFEGLVARRYRGQGDTLVSPLEADFHALHKERFGFARLDTEVETVEVRWRCRGPQRRLREEHSGDQDWSALGQRQLLTEQGEVTLPVMTGRLGVGQVASGPFLHFAAGSTLLVADGWQARGLAGGHMLLVRARRTL